MHKIIVFIPLEYAEKVKSAMFEAGAGKIGAYDSCSFETLGTGQFRPKDGSKPFLGKVDKIEQVSELKVEMVCEDKFVLDVILNMKVVHPYEEPAFDVIKLSDWEKSC